ncbi:Arm DNA-binding domain-containing protein, partial [Brevundimonas diminuta]
MPSPANLSTDRQIAALKPRDKPFEIVVSGARGLYVRMFPTGVRKFEYRYTSVRRQRLWHRSGVADNGGIGSRRSDV